MPTASCSTASGPQRAALPQTGPGLGVPNSGARARGAWPGPRGVWLRGAPMPWVPGPWALLLVLSTRGSWGSCNPPGSHLVLPAPRVLLVPAQLPVAAVGLPGSSRPFAHRLL